jgi:cobalt-zinc-cadmium efflux system protein
MRADEIADALAAVDGVDAVHHVHVWSLGSETPALSAHVVFDDDPTLAEAQIRGETLKRALLERFGIAHATLELESRSCAEDDVHG